MRIVFAGTPEPAVVALDKLIASRHEVAAVITRPDARRGRGRALRPSPVKELALQHGIEVLTPQSLRAGSDDGEALRAALTELSPEAIPVVAYGNLIPADLLAVPEHGWLNLHFSLLPAWRGAAPVQAAIAAGDDVTGATVFRIEEGLDTGPVLGTVTEPIGAGDTADDLLTRLAYSGADLLLSALDAVEVGASDPRAQEGEPSYAPKVTVEQARVDWQAPAFAVDRHIRAYTPGPGAWTMLGENRFKVGPVNLAAEPGAPDAPREPLHPGEIWAGKQAVFVGTATGPVRLGRVQPPGKKMMDAADWARGQEMDTKVRFQ